MLINLGCNNSDAKKIVRAIMDFINKGTPFLIGDEDELSKIKGVLGKHGDNLGALKD